MITVWGQRRITLSRIIEIYCRPFSICFRTQQEEKNNACIEPLVVFFESQINFLFYNGLYFDISPFNKNFCVAFLFILSIMILFQYAYAKLWSNNISNYKNGANSKYNKVPGQGIWINSGTIIKNIYFELYPHLNPS